MDSITSCKHVSFQAGGLENFLPEADEELVFPHVQHNAGGGYSASTGRFTAPCNGTYVFFLNLDRRYETQGKEVDAGLVHDNVWVTYARSALSTTEDYANFDRVTAST